MPFIISYYSKNKKSTYLKSDSSFTGDINDVSILKFKTIAAAKNSFTARMSDILLNRDKSRFFVYNPDNNEYFSLLTGQKEANLHRVMLNSIDDLVTHLLANESHAMVLDLEFFVSRSGMQHLRQIAAIMLNRPQKFINRYVFDPVNMTEATQLNFLKKSDLPYSEACKLKLASAMKDFKQFIQDNDVNTVVSWGNSLDFSVLESESCLNLLDDMTALDVGQVFNRLTPLTLQNICILLNLKNTGVWHNALDDATMINKVCGLYMHVLNDPDIVAKQMAAKEALSPMVPSQRSLTIVPHNPEELTLFY